MLDFIVLHEVSFYIQNDFYLHLPMELGPVNHICQIFEEQTTQYKNSHCHKIPGFGKDFSTVLDVLDSEKIFTVIPGQQHKSFKSKHEPF